jgi:hypothetical protein
MKYTLLPINTAILTQNKLQRLLKQTTTFFGS